MKKTLPILIYPHPILRKKAVPVDPITPEILGYLDSMVTTMTEGQGVGLAANQVGLLHRITVLDFDILYDYMERYGENTEGLPRGILKIINPTVRDISPDMYTHKGEGCMSIPDVYTEVERPFSITLDYTDETGKAQSYRLHQLAAAAVLHEIDHLDGVLFLDHLSKLKANMIEKKYKKARAYFVKYPRYGILTQEQGEVAPNLDGWKD
ncbi:MAG: peptide deformylase [Alphaproteobacteria bacterium CG_4_10_14_0_8_um_filter_53_9]|nr:MAG: peptide deformylase [Alphaproteobacteria bacterium CG_4_10_14_0_8_um_filter_53_9]